MLLSAAAAANPQIQGFSKDGRYFVWYEASSPDMDMSPAVAYAQDLRTGVQQSWTLQDVDPDKLEGQNEKLDAFLKAHPLVDAVASRTSPDGKSTADIVVEGQGDGVWDKHETWTSSGNAGWTLVITRDGKQRRAGACSGGARVSVFWSPDGKRTVWLAEHGGTNMRDPGYTEMVIGTDGAPAVGIAAEKPKLADAGKIAEKLSAAGFAVVNLTTAKKARPASVVYASKGLEDEAKKLAAAVPGGATVEKLDWSSPLDLVVALGPAAYQ